MANTVLLERQDNIAIVTIDRPEALNALNSTVIAELEQVVTALESDRDVRCMILTGEGRSFTIEEQRGLVDLCAKGIDELLAKQREALALAEKQAEEGSR